jgi:hypothetical protein
MFHYSPSSRFQGYTSYLPRRSHFPAAFDIDEAPSSDYGLEDLGYTSLSQSLLPPSLDAETRYRRALYELEAAEQEYQAHIALERTRQAAAIRKRAVAEAVRREREREIALYAEVERIKQARSFQEQVEERLAQRQCGLQTQVPFDRVHRGRHAFKRGICGDAERECAPQGHRARPQPDDETFSIGDLLGLFAGVHPERQRSSLPQGPTSDTSSQPHHTATAHTQPQPRGDENVEVNLSNILEFFHSIAAHAGGAAGGESTHEVRLSVRRCAFHCLIWASQQLSQPEATRVDVKGKGKVNAQPVLEPEPTVFESLFRNPVSGARDQELRDMEYAIKLSLQDRDATDIKKAHTSRASQSSADASSSKVSQ